jgi:F0F1-type ATP synthase membrane subunit a
MISGHSILHIISSAGLYLYTIGFFYLLFIPYIFLLLLFLLEIGVSVIQAYVFTILTLTYLKDVLFIKH